MSDLRTVAGGGHLLRGKNFNPNDDGATWANAGGGGGGARAASVRLQLSMATWPRGLTRRRCCEAGGVTGAGEVAADGWLSD